MKKFLLLTFALIAFGAYAQDNDEILREQGTTETADILKSEEVRQAAEELQTRVLEQEEVILQEEIEEKAEENWDVESLSKKKKSYDPRTYIPKRHYINLSYATQKLQYPGLSTIKSSEGAAIEFGSTFFFNARKPVLTPYVGAIRFGLDFTYLDITAAQFDLWDSEGNKLDSYFGNIGMQIGPSVTITPLRRLNIRLYGHYAPSAVAFTLDKFEEVTYGYAGYVTGGLQVSYMFMTLGVELRGTTAKLNSISEDNFSAETPSLDDLLGLDPNDIGVGDVAEYVNFDSGPKEKVKLPGVRFTFGFRF